jgi:hypothetical protein
MGVHVAILGLISYSKKVEILQGTGILAGTDSGQIGIITGRQENWQMTNFDRR